MSGSKNEKLPDVVRDAFRTLKEYKSLDPSMLSELYVDPKGFNEPLIIKNILTANKNYLIEGRRGTGKSTILFRAYNECSDSLNNKSFLLNNKALGVYINLLTVFIDSEKEELKIIWITFLEYLLNKIYEEINKTHPGVIEKLKKTKTKTLREIEEIKKQLLDGKLIGLGEVDSTEINDYFEKKEKYLEGNLSYKGLLVADLKGGFSKLSEDEKFLMYKTKKRRYEIFNEVIPKINELLKNFKIEGGMHIFLDDYSEIPIYLQSILADDIFPILINNEYKIFVHLAVYPARYYLGRYSQTREFEFENLDFINMYEDVVKEIPENSYEQRYVKMVGRACDFTRLLISKRLDYFSKKYEIIEDIYYEIFEKSQEKEILKSLFLISMNVPRNLGFLLQKIVGSKFTRKINSKMVDIKAPNMYDFYKKDLVNKISSIYDIDPKKIFYLWGEILSEAKKLKKAPSSKKKQPSSFFMLNSNFRNNFAPIEGSFLIFHIGKMRPKSIGKGYDAFDADSQRYDVFYLNYGVCLRENIVFEYDSKIIKKNQFDFTKFVKSQEGAYCYVHKFLKSNQVQTLINGREVCFLCIEENRTFNDITYKIEKRKPIDSQTQKEIDNLEKETTALQIFYDKNIISKNQRLESEIISVLISSGGEALSNKEIAEEISEIIGYELNYAHITWGIKRINQKSQEILKMDLIETDSRGMKYIQTKN